MKFDEQYFKDAQKVIMDVLKKARPELLQHHGKIDYELKNDASVVTRLDRELELKLKSALLYFDNSVGVWGEEHGREGSEENYWLIDPIDGTEALIRGLSGCRNILTFVSSDSPLFALIYRFTTDDLFLAREGRPTIKNGEAVQLSERPLDRAWLEFSVNMRLPDGYNIYQKLRPAIAGITVHRDFLEILEGKLEGIVVYKSAGEVWDYAPRALMIKGAGGKASNIGNDDYNLHDKNIVATTASIFNQTRNLIDEALEVG